MIHPHHRRELTEGSAIAPALAELNVESVEGDRVIGFLAQNLPNDARRNDGRLRDHWLRHFQPLADGGGLIFSHVGGEWQYKPNNPRKDPHKLRKIVKYETPRHSKLGAYLPRVDRQTASIIAERYNLSLPDNYAPEDFWGWIETHIEIPIVLTEGAKKALAALSAGYAAIAVGGCRMACRRNEETGKLELLPEIQKLAVTGRYWHLAFDQDRKKKTRQDVSDAITKTARLLTKQECEVKIVSWNPQAGKGLDDLIFNKGAIEFHKAIYQAVPFSTWQLLRGSALNYQRALEVCQRYLDVEIPATARLVGIRSPKDTGKSFAIANLIEKVIRDFDGRRILVLTHRIQLGRQLADRFGLPYITDVSQHAEGNVFGQILCVDSLHPKSQARFRSEDWEDCIVIVDEVEQVVQHTLNSSTCRSDRVAILRSLEEVLRGASQVIVADADLSDVSLDHLRALMGGQPQPYIIENTWKPSPEQAPKVFHYRHTQPDAWLDRLLAAIANGEKVLIHTVGQKPGSTWGTQALEELIGKAFPHARILRIDSETVAEPGHPALGCVEKLNETLINYDVAIASPTIETGVSIDIQGHFSSVWGCFWGKLAPNSIRQCLARLRENIPRHIWVQRVGMEQIGNGSIFPEDVLAGVRCLANQSQKYLQQYSHVGELLQSASPEDCDLEFQVPSLRTWAVMAARQNFGMQHLREATLLGLENEGCQIEDVTNVDAESAKQAKKELKTSKEAVYEANVERRSSVEIIKDDRQLQQLEDKQQRTPEERAQLAASKLARKLETDKLTPELIRLHDDGRIAAWENHYYLTEGNEFLPEHDWRKARSAFEQGGVFLPDFASSQKGAKFEGLKRLGVLDLLKAQEFRSKDDPLLAPIARYLKDKSWETRTYLGFNPTRMSDIEVLKALLRPFGLTVIAYRKEGGKGQQVQIYSKLAPDFLQETVTDKNGNPKQRLCKDAQGNPIPLWDDRKQVFERWLKRDRREREEYERKFKEAAVLKEKSQATPVTREELDAVVIGKPETVGEAIAQATQEEIGREVYRIVNSDGTFTPVFADEFEEVVDFEEVIEESTTTESVPSQHPELQSYQSGEPVWYYFGLAEKWVRGICKGWSHLSNSLCVAVNGHDFNIHHAWSRESVAPGDWMLEGRV